MILLLPPAAAPAAPEGTAGIHAPLPGSAAGGAGAARSPAMGKDQELLEAARTGNVALVEKLLSGGKEGSWAVDPELFPCPAC